MTENRIFDVDALLHLYRFNLTYAHALVEDLPNCLMTVRPCPGLENHPAFTLGHLVSGAAFVGKYLRAPVRLPAGWDLLFSRKGPGDPSIPPAYPATYPSKDDLLHQLTLAHEQVEGLVKESNSEFFQRRLKWRFSHYFPTIGDAVWFLCVTHESMHLGQLACWRRAMHLPGALAKL